MLYATAIKANYVASMKREYEAMASELPIASDVVVDIGAGLGGIDIFLARHYPAATFFLLDKNENSATTAGFSSHHGFYNSFSKARELLTEHGMKEEQIHFLTPEQTSLLPVPNLILSLLSCGFHYPLSTYQNIFERCLHDRGTVIVDIRKGSGQEEEARKIGTVKIIHEDWCTMRVKITA